TTIYDIPQFDLALAHELYRLLLEPVEAAWKPATSLIVATNGALGLLPLSLLPTAPPEPMEGDSIPFAQYRKIPCLARSHAVTIVPRAAAVRTRRNLAQGSGKREPLIGFGDPYFSAAQVAEDREQLIKVAALPERGTVPRRHAAVETRHIDTAD